MNIQDVTLAEVIRQYNVPLQRLARRLLKSELLAIKVVAEVFEECYDLNLLLPGVELRGVLKERVVARCARCKKILALAREALHEQGFEPGPAFVTKAKPAGRPLNSAGDGL